MKVVVTGGSGFVGSHLIARLRLEGHEVVATGRTVPGEPARSGVDWETWEGGQLTSSLQAKVKDAELVYHLVARTHVMDDRAEDVLKAYREVNVEGTTRLMEAIGPQSRVVFLSSVKAVAEASPGRPLDDGTPPTPTTPYGITKLEAERLLLAALPGRVAVIRPPLVYGPGVKANFLRLLGLARKGWPLPLGSLRNKRSMVFTGNLVDGLLKAGTDARALDRCFFISDGVDLSTADLIEGLARAMGAPARLWPCPPGLLLLAGRLLGKGEELQRLVGDLQLDISGLRQTLDWTPPFSTEAAFSATAGWYLARPL